MEPSDKRKGTWFGLDKNTIITVVGWICMGFFYLGVHKQEMEDFKGKLDVIEHNQTDFQAKLLKLDTEGGSATRRIDSDMKNIKTDVAILDTTKSLIEQRNGNIELAARGLDVRVTRLEDAIPKIALLNQQFDSMKDTLNDLKESNKKIPEIQVSIAQIKTMLDQRNLLKPTN